VLLAAAIFLPRLTALDRFVTVDEATWVMRSANFYYALSQRAFEKTLAAYHPAVTTMWAGALATWIEYPEYRGLGQGYFIKEWKFADFLAAEGHHPLEILKTARLITALVNAALLLHIFWLARKLFGDWAAFGMAVVLALDPFLLGHTRILAHEGMMSLLMVLSILCLLVYIDKSEPIAYLLGSAAAASLAVLTKSSALILVGFAAALLLWKGLVLDRRAAAGGGVGGPVGPFLRRYLGWLAVFVLGYVLFWPGMWVSPGEMLYQAFGNAFSYFVAGRNLVALENDLDPGFLSSASGLWTYLVSFLWHATPAVLLGVIIAGASVFFRLQPGSASLRRAAIVFLIFGAAFHLVMGLAGGRKSAHYVMFSQAAFETAAVLGTCLLVRASELWRTGRFRRYAAALAIGLLALHAISFLPYYPYYFTYQNPLTRRLDWARPYQSLGYGEVLEQAAAYLALKPAAEDLTALVWYGIGPFSYYFPGQTELILPTRDWNQSLVERLRRSDYLVLYYDHQLKRGLPAKLMQDIQGVAPETAIRLHGIEYIRIYRVGDLPDRVFEPDMTSD
jgi:4-amino-4-deoxy-L-arabinose transferase-like glycosyltransferase